MKFTLLSVRVLFAITSALLFSTVLLKAESGFSNKQVRGTENVQLRSLELDEVVFIGSFDFKFWNEIYSATTHKYVNILNTTYFSEAIYAFQEACSQEYMGDTYNGVGIMNDGVNHLKGANDFVVPAETKFTVETIQLEVVSLGGMPTTFEVSFYVDDNQGVGAQLGDSQSGLTADITPNGVFGDTDFPQWTVVITLPESVTFNNPGQTDVHYWVGVSGAPSDTNDNIYWVSYLYDTSSGSYPMWQTLNGTIWFEYEDTSSQNQKVEGIMTLSGECSESDSESEDGCDWVVRVWDDFYGDEVSWTLKDSTDNIILSGGGYGLGYDDLRTVYAEGPLTFYIEAMGVNNDNEPNYSISNELGIIASGEIAGNQATHTDLNCDTQPESESCEGSVIDSFPFIETFEDDSFTRPCWLNEFENGSISWTYRAGAGNGGLITGAHSGDKNANFSASSYAQYITKLTSPQFDFAGMENVTLTFWYANQSWAGDLNELRVYYKNSINGTWTMIPGAVYNTNVTEWTEVNLNLPESADKSEYFIAFEGLNNWGYGLVVDDVEIMADEAPEQPGCLDAPNGEWGEYTPYCIGVPEVIVDDGWTGEYSTIHLTAGVEYTFSSSVPTDFITISDATAQITLAYGSNPVVWTPESNGAYRFYVHLDENCNHDEEFRERIIQCGTQVIIEEPDFDCFQGDGTTSSFDEALPIDDPSYLIVADDFIVAPGTEFLLRQITIDVNQPEIPNEATIHILEDNDGVPGELSASINMAPTNAVLYGVFFGEPVYHLTFDLAEPIVLSEGKYWLQPEISVQSQNTVWWVATTEGSTGEPAMLSDDGGNNWEVFDIDMNMVFFVAGDCNELPEEPGCLDAPNGQWGEYTPYCLGIPETVAPLSLTGEYSLVHLTAGVEYTFSSSVETDFITISNEDGTLVFVYGYSPLVYTPDVGTTVRFYTHLDENCNYDPDSYRDRFIQCGNEIIIDEPDFECFQGNGITSSFDDAYNITASSEFRTADDFTVDTNTSFTLRQITIDVNQQEIPDDVTINIHQDNGGQPGEIIHEINIEPADAVLYATAFGDPIYHLIFDLDTPLVFTEGVYWIEPFMSTPGSNAVGWLATSTNPHGSAPYRSTDGGTTWEADDSGLDMVFFVAGECEEMGTGDIDNSVFAYWPNPVKDVLNISTQKEIKSVEAFNLTGQRVLNQIGIQNGTIDVSALNPGAYMFRIIFDKGQRETIKIIKK